jgi:hypothetical protein
VSSERDAHVRSLPAKGDGGRTVDTSMIPAEHREESIETLFRRYFAQSRGSALQMPASTAVSSRRLRAAWKRSGLSVSFDQFAQDASAALRRAYDRKYGVWDDVNDLRSMYRDSWHSAILPYTSSLQPDARILGVGINDGREIRQLFGCPTARFDLVDISAKAIGQLVHRLSDYRRIRSFVGTFEDWIPDHNEYDLFFSLRTLNCTAVDLSTSVGKSIELVKSGGTLIYSVANGYVHLAGGRPKALNGLFSYETGVIDPQRPREVATEIVGEIDSAGATVLKLAECPTEIFIVATKECSPRVARNGLR